MSHHVYPPVASVAPWCPRSFRLCDWLVKIPIETVFRWVSQFRPPCMRVKNPNRYVRRVVGGAPHVTFRAPPSPPQSQFSRIGNTALRYETVGPCPMWNSDHKDCAKAESPHGFTRPPPGWQTKRFPAWNGLMIMNTSLCGNRDLTSPTWVVCDSETETETETTDRSGRTLEPRQWRVFDFWVRSRPLFIYFRRGMETGPSPPYNPRNRGS